LFSFLGYYATLRWFKTDVWGIPIGPIVKGQSSRTALPLKMGPIGRPETSIPNRLKPHNNPEDGRIRFNSGGSLTQCTRGVKIRKHTSCCHINEFGDAFGQHCSQHAILFTVQVFLPLRVYKQKSSIRWISAGEKVSAASVNRC
jgi:hypothetical protein